MLTAPHRRARAISAIDRRITARYTRQVRRLATSARDALAGYVAGSALVAAINGSLIGAMAALVGVPMPLMLAVWAFSWNFVPQIGAIIGWAPVLILAIVLHPIADWGASPSS
ncbi:MAG: AI-2E family transporter [Acidimicrobiales bacterium]